MKITLRLKKHLTKPLAEVILDMLEFTPNATEIRD